MLMNNDNAINAIKNQQNKAFFKNKSLFSIYEFQDLVVRGFLTDDVGVASLVINGELREEFNVFIDRRIITKTGAIISFAGLLKMYGADNIFIKCEPRLF